MNASRFLAGMAAMTVALTSGIALAQAPKTAPQTTPADSLKPMAPGDRQFVMDTVRDNEREVDMGDLAREKAQRTAVREFGAQMVQDHGRAATELKALALKRGVRVGDTKRGGEEPAVSWLTKVSPAEFDKVYIDTMVKDHQKDVAEFRRMSQELQDPDLRAWAAKTLPTLEEHLRKVTALQAQAVGAVR